MASQSWPSGSVIITDTGAVQQHHVASRSDTVSHAYPWGPRAESAEDCRAPARRLVMSALSRCHSCRRRTRGGFAAPIWAPGWLRRADATSCVGQLCKWRRESRSPLGTGCPPKRSYVVKARLASWPESSSGPHDQKRRAIRRTGAGRSAAQSAGALRKTRGRTTANGSHVQSPDSHVGPPCDSESAASTQGGSALLL